MNSDAGQSHSTFSKELQLVQHRVSKGRVCSSSEHLANKTSGIKKSAKGLRYASASCGW